MLEYRLAPPHDQLLNRLMAFLNPRWIDRERSKPSPVQHVVARWIHEIQAFPGRYSPLHAGGEVFTGPASGELQELIGLAIDVDIVQTTAPVPRLMVERLRDRHEFQGARYELLAAATILRAGIPIVWQEAKAGGPEFWAYVRGTGQRLAVEAKSRRRVGALHQHGTRDSRSYLADVSHLLRDAEQKSVDECPLIVFVDLNLEDRPDTDGEPAWMPQIRDLMKRFDNAREQPKFALAIFSNFAWHYSGKQLVPERPASSSYLPTHSVRPLRFRWLRARLDSALREYGAPLPPHFFGLGMESPAAKGLSALRQPFRR
jgi:hypothetical protein